MGRITKLSLSNEERRAEVSGWPRGSKEFFFGLAVKKFMGAPKMRRHQIWITVQDIRDLIQAQTIPSYHHLILPVVSRRSTRLIPAGEFRITDRYAAMEFLLHINLAFPHHWLDEAVKCGYFDFSIPFHFKEFPAFANEINVRFDDDGTEGSSGSSKTLFPATQVVEMQDSRRIDDRKLASGKSLVRWEDLEIRIKFDNELEWRIGTTAKFKPATARDLGLESKNSKRPDGQWTLLLAISQAPRHEIPNEAGEARNAFKMKVNRLSTRLMEYFKHHASIDERPYLYDPRQRVYRFRFRIAGNRGATKPQHYLSQETNDDPRFVQLERRSAIYDGDLHIKKSRTLRPNKQ